jgi:transposase-like protein
MTRRKRYSAEFKREAIRRANEEGVTEDSPLYTLCAFDRQLTARR